MTKVGRNDPCPCGSGKKYKRCCLAKDEQEAEAARAAAEAERQKAAAEEEPAQDDASEAEPKPVQPRRQHGGGKSRFWGSDDRPARGGGGKGLRHGSGHR